MWKDENLMIMEKSIQLWIPGSKVTFRISCIDEDYACKNNE